jgi:hypothetical protein
MFGFMSKEKRKEKEVVDLLSFCVSYSKFCMDRVTEIKGEPISSDEIKKILASDDNIQFWYTVALAMTFQAGLGDESLEEGEELALILGRRILMEFQGLDDEDDDVMDKAIALHKSGQDKYHTGECDRNFKVHVAAATASKNLWTTKEITELPIHIYVTFICKIDEHLSTEDTTFAELDSIMGEEAKKENNQ